MIGYCVCVCVCVCVLLDAVYSFRLPVPMIITIFISCILQLFGGVKVVLTFAAAAAAAAAAVLSLRIVERRIPGEVVLPCVEDFVGTHDLLSDFCT